MGKAIKGFISVLAVIGLLAGCAAVPETTPTSAPVDSEKAALEDQVEILNGKIEQLQNRIDELQKENAALLNDSSASMTVDDLTYLLYLISASGQTLTSFPALVSEVAASGEGYMLTIDRLEYNPDYEAGGTSSYLLNAEEALEEVYADHFTYACYDGYLMPELDDGFAEYINSISDAAFTVYMLGDQVIFLNVILNS